MHTHWLLLTVFVVFFCFLLLYHVFLLCVCIKQAPPSCVTPLIVSTSLLTSRLADLSVIMAVGSQNSPLSHSLSLALQIHCCSVLLGRRLPLRLRKPIRRGVGSASSFSFGLSGKADKRLPLPGFFALDAVTNKQRKKNQGKKSKTV
jgi:hypothetical protein